MAPEQPTPVIDFLTHTVLVFLHSTSSLENKNGDFTHPNSSKFRLGKFLDHPKDNPKCNLNSPTFVHKTGSVTRLSAELSLGLYKDASSD